MLVGNKKNKVDVLLFAAANTSPVRDPTTERLPVFYHTIGQRGRLTSLQKVILPQQCNSLPQHHLIVCCNQAVPAPLLVFCLKKPLSKSSYLDSS